MPTTMLMVWVLVCPVLAGLVAAAWRGAGARVSGLMLVGAAAYVAVQGVLAGSWPLAFDTLVLTLAAAAFVLSPEAVAHAVDHRDVRSARTYYLLLGLFGSTLLMLAEPWPLLYLWVAVEATTLISVALVALPVGAHPFEAAWKYMMIAGMGGLLALGGLLLAGSGARGAEEAGALLMLVGFGAKAGLVPFHTWLPDAHSQAPAPVSGLLSGAELAGVMWVLHRAMTLVGERLGSPTWPSAGLIGLGLVSMLLGIGAMSAQGNVKRFLAYSSIEHMGIIAIGFGIGGVAALGALLHVITHGFAKGQCFLASGTIQAHCGSVDGGQLGGLHRRVPWTSGGLGLGLAALAGLPPFGPFWSEWMIVGGGLAHSSTRLVGAALALLLVLGFLSIAYRAPRWWAERGGGEMAPVVRETPWQASAPLILGALTASAGIFLPLALHWNGLIH